MSRSDSLSTLVVKSTVPRKIVVTVLTSGLVYGVTALAHTSAIWAVILSTFIGGVALVVQFLIDFDSRLQRIEATQESRLQRIEATQESRLQRIEATQESRLQRIEAIQGTRLDALQTVQGQRTDEMEGLIREGFLRINEATELFGLVETSALRTDVVTQFVRNSTQIEPEPPLVFDFAQGEIFRMSKFLKDIATGDNVMYEGEDRDWLLGLARHSHINIDATSLTTVDSSGGDYNEGGLWDSDLGHRYLEVQREAIQRGVRVRRVFIVNRFEPSRYPNLSEICRMQRSIGIQVRIIAAQKTSGLLRNSLSDFIVFDDVISYEVIPGPRLEDGAPATMSTHLILGERVKERIRRFRDLWESASDFQE